MLAGHVKRDSFTKICCRTNRPVSISSRMNAARSARLILDKSLTPREALAWPHPCDVPVAVAQKRPYRMSGSDQATDSLTVGNRLNDLFKFIRFAPYNSDIVDTSAKLAPSV